MNRPNPALIPASELAAQLADSKLHILDASWYHPRLGQDARTLHAEARLPGARHFDIDAVAAGDGSLPHMLPDAAGFAAAAGALGIGAGDRVLIYDQTGMASAACRLWWTFRCFGHEKVAVLDGGLPEWRRARLPLASGEAEPVQTLERATHAAGLPVWDLEQVRENIASRKRLFLDARSPGRFAGHDEEPWGEPGRVPGSVNLPYEELLDPENGRFLPLPALEDRFAAAGAEAGRPLLLCCGSGVTACVLALALHLLDRENAALYDGSWVDWVRREGTQRTRD